MIKFLISVGLYPDQSTWESCRHNLKAVKFLVANKYNISMDALHRCYCYGHEDVIEWMTVNSDLIDQLTIFDDEDQ